jgi:hypothetical protein
MKIFGKISNVWRPKSQKRQLIINNKKKKLRQKTQAKIRNLFFGGSLIQEYQHKKTGSAYFSIKRQI